MTTLEQKTLELFFLAGIFEWFDLVDSQKDDTTMRVTLQEKNIPQRDYFFNLANFLSTLYALYHSGLTTKSYAPAYSFIPPLKDPESN